MKKQILQSVVLLTLIAFALPLFAEGGAHAAHEAASHTATAHGEPHFPWANWAWTMTSFLVFVGILYWKAYPAMQDFFAKRKEEIVENINAAKALREEAKIQLELFEKKLSSLEAERQTILDEYHEQGERERDRLIGEAKKQVEKMRVDAEMIISQETRKAVQAIEKQAVDEAIGLAMTKLTTTMNDKAQNGLVDNFVSELRAMD